MSLGGGWTTTSAARWQRVGTMLILAGVIKSVYAPNPKAGDVVFRLPVPATTRFRASITTNMWWQQVVLECAAGSKDVKLISGETGDYRTGTEITLSGLTIDVA